MSHVPSKSQHIVRPNLRPLDKQMESLDRAHQARQNAKAVPVKLTTPKPKRPQQHEQSSKTSSMGWGWRRWLLNINSSNHLRRRTRERLTGEEHPHQSVLEAFAAAFMKVAKLASEMQEEELRSPAPALHSSRPRSPLTTCLANAGVSRSTVRATLLVALTVWLGYFRGGVFRSEGRQLSP